MRDQLTLGRALAMVGGPKKEAKLSDVRIYRQKPGSPDQEMIRVDYAEIKKNKQADVCFSLTTSLKYLKLVCSRPSRIGNDVAGNDNRWFEQLRCIDRTNDSDKNSCIS